MRGVVIDSEGRAVAGATVRVEERNKDVLTTGDGEYWRVLVPGTYRIRAIKDNKESEEVEVEVLEGDQDGPTVNLALSLTSTSTTTPLSTQAEEEEYLEFKDPLGLVCFRFSWEAWLTLC